MVMTPQFRSVDVVSESEPVEKAHGKRFTVCLSRLHWAANRLI